MSVALSRFFTTRRDGGPTSTVMGYWLAEIKTMFTVAVLRFDRGTREAFHGHAFNSVSWVLTGGLEEVMYDGTIKVHRPSLLPVVTRRKTFHKVIGLAEHTWVLTFRGPWSNKWYEIDEAGKRVVLTHGRYEISK